MTRRSVRAPRHGLARVLSKAGLCSRTEAARWIVEGRVRIDGRVVRDPEHPVAPAQHAGIDVDGRPLVAAARVHVMLNKPRGLVTTARDEHDRDTVYRCLEGAGLPWMAPVGRLDRASEGLLLMTNDPAWAAGITERGPNKTYHVQVDAQPDAALLARIAEGVERDGETLRAVAVRPLREGTRNAWLEIELDEGRNRHIRRLLEAFDLRTLRLVRVAIGALQLGALAKGAWRLLTAEEVARLSSQRAPVTDP